MTSPQTLSLADRRIVAEWAADCAERVLPLFEDDVPNDVRPREAILRARAFAAGDLSAADEIRRRFVAGRAARAATTGAAKAAARAAAQAAGVAHMGAHALGAAAYAAQAAGLAQSGDAGAACDEIAWQLARLSVPAHKALQQLPNVGSDSAGPLGTGLLASGLLGTIITALQAELAN